MDSRVDRVERVERVERVGGGKRMDDRVERLDRLEGDGALVAEAGGSRDCIIRF